MAPRTEPTSKPDRWANTAEEWAAAKHHKVVMPSGRKAVIQIPELGLLVLANALPDDLLELARAELTHPAGATGAYGEQVAELLKTDQDGAQEKAQELTARFGGLLKWLVAEHVLVEPKVTVAELSDDRFPLQDLDWLYGVALRRVNEDALGRRLGVASLDQFRVMAEKHGCAPDCDACLQVVDAFSTADLGAL